MKDIFFRSPLVYLLVFTITSASFYCSESSASFYPPEMKNSKKMKFKFEDYDVKSPEIVQSKLSQLFPKGSSLSEFQKAMERSGSKCDVSSEKGDSSMYCRQLVGRNPFVKSKWIVKVKIGNDNNIDELTVTSGLVGT
jgi:hypothetical protein